MASPCGPPTSTWLRRWGHGGPGGAFLKDATARYPAVVLGAEAAERLGIDRADGQVQVWLGQRWFTVVGILAPVTLGPEIDRSALVGYPVAAELFATDPSPSSV